MVELPKDTSLSSALEMILGALKEANLETEWNQQNSTFSICAKNSNLPFRAEVRYEPHIQRLSWYVKTERREYLIKETPNLENALNDLFNGIRMAYYLSKENE
jgi:hypothetical protein